MAVIQAMQKKCYKEKMTMSGAKKLKVLGGTLIVLFLMNSCTDFFTSSWGEAFKRDPKKVKVTESNVYDLLEAAQGDPALSREILDKIKADSSPELKKAAFKAANQAAGVTTLVLENVQTLIESAEGDGDKAALEEVAEAILEEAEGNGLEGISDKLEEIFQDDIAPTGKPVFTDEHFLDDVPESDLTLVVMTLILAKVEKEERENNRSLDDYIQTWSDKNMETGAGLDADERLIAALVNGMDDTSDLTEKLKDLLGDKDE
jgi:hypothetical protein